jgi:hypothetical protein
MVNMIPLDIIVGIEYHDYRISVEALVSHVRVYATVLSDTEGNN